MKTLDKMNKAELTEHAESLGVLVPGDWSKAQIRQAIDGLTGSAPESAVTPSPAPAPRAPRPWAPGSPRG